MKDFNEFKNSFSSDDLSEICNEKIQKLNKLSEDMNFEDATEKLIWYNRSLSVSLIFEFLEKYHNWLNDN